MPLMDGFEFVNKAKTLLADIPKTQWPKFVAVTGNVENNYVELCLEQGFD